MKSAYNIKNSCFLLLQNIGITFLYFATSEFGFWLTTPGHIISPIWLPGGVAFVAVLLGGNRLLPGVLLGSFLTGIQWTAFSLSLAITAIIGAIGVLIQVSLAVWILRKFSSSIIPFFRVRDVFVFVLGSALFASMISPTFGIPILWVLGYIPTLQLDNDWVIWWLSDVVGVLVVGTVFLSWYKTKFILSGKKIFELLVLLTFIFGTLVIMYKEHYPISFLMIAFTIWSVLRFNLQITSLLCLIISILIVLMGIHGLTQFVVQDFHESLLLLQAFTAIIFFTALILFAVLSEQREAQHNLEETNEKLEVRVHERTKDLAKKNHELSEAMQHLKEKESQLVQAEKMSSLGVLTAGIAHEINNSINFISANLNPLKNDFNDLATIVKQYSDLPSPPTPTQLNDIKKTITEMDLNFTLNEIPKLLEGITEGTNRTTVIVKDLRTFSRLDESMKKKTNIHENIDSTLNLLKSQFSQRITIVKNYAELPEIDCYPGKLNQVFMNIITNAIHAIPDKGEIHITTSAENKNIVIKIRDSGTGIPPDVIKKIFEPFFTTKEVGKGTGLGLSISYGIIQDHHGTLSVESEVGKGTEFTITLPIS